MPTIFVIYSPRILHGYTGLQCLTSRGLSVKVQILAKTSWTGARDPLRSIKVIQEV